MTNYLASIRASKASGVSLEDAIKATSELAIATSPSEASNIEEKTTDPFHTPAASHIDPLTSSPVNNSPNPGFSSASFTSPSFANFGIGDGGNGDVPF